MVSPLRFKDSISIAEYDLDEEAKFTAFLDIQLEEEILLPFEEDITTYIKENIFKQ